MANTQVLRRRIHSVENTAKICKAMEMIATAKMKRAQDQAMAGRPYAEKIGQVISNLSAQAKYYGDIHPLLKRREVRKIAIVHFTTDRGLCGGLNANLNRLVAEFILRQHVPAILITVGRKGRNFMLSTGQTIRAEFTGIKDKPGLLDIMPISRIVIDAYTMGEIDMIYLAYPRFVSTMVQRPTMETLLPVDPVDFNAVQTGDYIYEPDHITVMNELLPRFVEMKTYHTLLELIASEHSARMVSMRSASDSAKDVLEDLTLTLNKARQETITNEICDICGGAEALK